MDGIQWDLIHVTIACAKRLFSSRSLQSMKGKISVADKAWSKWGTWRGHVEGELVLLNLPTIFHEAQHPPPLSPFFCVFNNVQIDCKEGGPPVHTICEINGTVVSTGVLDMLEIERYTSLAIFHLLFSLRCRYSVVILASKHASMMREWLISLI